MIRNCIKCERVIERCNGAVVARDIMALEVGLIPLEEVREVCPRHLDYDYKKELGNTVGRMCPLSVWELIDYWDHCGNSAIREGGK